MRVAEEYRQLAVKPYHQKEAFEEENKAKNKNEMKKRKKFLLSIAFRYLDLNVSNLAFSSTNVF